MLKNDKMKKLLFNHLCKQQPVMLTIITMTTVNICTTLTMYQALLLGPHLVPTVTEADDRHIIMTPHIVPRWQSCFSKPGNSGSLNFALNHEVCDTHLMRTRDWLKDKGRKFKKAVLNKFLLKKYFIFLNFICLFTSGLSCGMWPGLEPRTPVLGLWSLRHWTSREVLRVF